MAPHDPISGSGDSQHDPHGHGEGAQPEGELHTNGSATAGTLSRLGPQLPSTTTMNWSYGPPPKPEILSAKPNPVELLHAVRRRWTLALGLGMTAAGLVGALMWFLIPVRYEAYATVKVSGKDPSVLQGGRLSAKDFELFKATQQQLISSNLVLNAVLREPSINRLPTVQEHSDDQVDWLKGTLSVNYPGDTEIMRVAVRTERKEDSLKLANKVVEVYLEEIVQHEKQTQLENEAQLERAAERFATDYTEQLRRLKELQNQYRTKGSQEAELKKQLAVDELRQLIARRNVLLSELSNNEMIALLIEAKLNNPDAAPPEVMIDMQLEQDPQIAQLRQSLMGMHQYLAQIRSQTTGPNATPHVADVQRQILRLEEQIEELKHERRPRLLEMWRLNSNQPGGGNNLSMEQLAKQREVLEARLKQADELLATKTEEVAKMDSFSALVAAAEEDLVNIQKIKNQLHTRMEQIRIERLAPERITKVEDAVLDGNGDAVRKYMGVIFAAIFAFSGVVLGVAVMEFQSRKVNSVGEVNDGLGIRVVGELPSVRGRAFRRLGGGKGQNVLKALMAERIDGTRTALIHTTAIDPPRVVMVTSADPREGKTTTASQLAASLARSGRRTLLIDADIRSPGVHRVFEMPQDPGLSELLRGEADREAVIHPTRTSNLWLMPGGRCDLRSVQALSGSYLGSVIAALSVQFDYVIVDAGPVLKVADPLLVGQHVDAAIISVLKDVSKVPQVYEAVERLRSVGITVLGSVVNGVKDDVARHGVELLMAETHREEAETASTS